MNLIKQYRGSRNECFLLAILVFLNLFVFNINNISIWETVSKSLCDVNFTHEIPKRFALIRLCQTNKNQPTSLNNPVNVGQTDECNYKIGDKRQRKRTIY
eukprot:UN01262